MADEIDVDNLLAELNNPAYHAAYHPAFGRHPDDGSISRHLDPERRPYLDRREQGRQNIPKQGARRPGGYNNFGRWLNSKAQGVNKVVHINDIHHENIRFLHHGVENKSILRPLISYSERNAEHKSGCHYGSYKDGDRFRCIKNPDHHHTGPRLTQKAVFDRRDLPHPNRRGRGRIAADAAERAIAAARRVGPSAANGRRAELDAFIERRSNRTKKPIERFK